MAAQKYTRPDSRAVQRNETRRASGMRLARTIVLGTVATVVAIIWLGEQYGIEGQVMLEFMATSALFVGLLVLLGLLGAVVLWLIKKVIR